MDGLCIGFLVEGMVGSRVRSFYCDIPHFVCRVAMSFFACCLVQILHKDIFCAGVGCCGWVGVVRKEGGGTPAM